MPYEPFTRAEARVVVQALDWMGSLAPVHYRNAIRRLTNYAVSVEDILVTLLSEETVMSDELKEQLAGVVVDQYVAEGVFEQGTSVQAPDIAVVSALFRVLSRAYVSTLSLAGNDVERLLQVSHQEAGEDAPSTPQDDLETLLLRDSAANRVSQPSPVSS